MLSDMLISGGLSAGLGAALSTISNLLEQKRINDKLRFARDKEEFTMILGSQDAAMKRDKSQAGQWIRRYIVVSLFTFITVLLWITGVCGLTAVYAYMEHVPERWFGLIRAKDVLRTVELPGIPVFDTIVNMCWLIGTFYFGSSRIK